MIPRIKILWGRLINLRLRYRVILVVVLVCVGLFGYTRLHTQSQSQASYSTTKAERGTIVVAVTGSGQVLTANSAPITTQASGVVNQVFVQDGDDVTAGDVIATVDLDMSGRQNEAQALASYQSAKNSLESARATAYSLQSAMLGEWQAHYSLATNSTYQNADGTPNSDNRALADFHISQDDWLAAEAKYKNQQNVIAQAQTALHSAWLTYQQASSSIYAPISGKVSGFSLQVGSVITRSSSSSSTTSSATTIAQVQTQALPSISINLTEIDVSKVHGGDLATVTFDALEDQTFVGKVVSIDTTGVVSSGVTTYPTVIRLDSNHPNILGNMAASASIITQNKPNVVLIPSSSIETQDGVSTVRIVRNGDVQTVTVEIGLVSDNQTEIISGVDVGDEVITSSTQTTTKSTTQGGQSIFSPFGRSGGGNIMRISR